MKYHRSMEEWTALIRKQEVSGMPATEFCRKEKINPGVFYRKRIQSGTGGFVRLPAAMHGSGGLDGMRIRIGEVIIEPGKDIDSNMLVHVIRSVLEACDARL